MTFAIRHEHSFIRFSVTPMTSTFRDLGQLKSFTVVAV